MTAERLEKIAEFRLGQPLSELQRRADKARNRAKLWTQEELDVADAEAREFCKFFNGGTD